MKKFVLGAAAMMSVAGTAQAATVVSVAGNAGNFIPALGGVTTFFEGSGDVLGIDLTLESNSSLLTGSPPGSAAPFVGAPFVGDQRDPTQYLNVTSVNGSALLESTGLYNAVSLYWGSVDTYNFIDLLDSGGNLIDTIDGSVVPPANGNQGAASRVNIFTEAGENAIASVRFRNTTSPAFEISNVTFFNAVPEPSTWMMMLAGFGILGGMMRRRPQTSRVSFV